MMLAQYYKKIFCFALLSISLLGSNKANAWGFFAHQRINRLAVFTLPPEMLGFYKNHILFLTENAVNPDKRRYAVKGEAPRHYIDIDIYGDSALYKMPRYWKEAVAKYTEDTLMAYGIVPWHINKMKYELIDAFRQKNASRILRISADIGHYIADAHVPLHTTHNYNGQLTGQVGIHGFWESRLPELFSNDYNFFVGQANYIKNVQLKAWEIVTQSHLALDSVFSFEKTLTAEFAPDKKYSYEERNRMSIRTYSREFSEAYHNMLNGQVERRMTSSIKTVGDFWYTCWVEAGQPSLKELFDFKFSEEELKEQEEKNKEVETRPHESLIREHNNDLEEIGCCGHMHGYLTISDYIIPKEEDK